MKNIFMKRIIPFVAICIFQMLFSTNTWCADLKKGATAYKNGDYAAALREWKPLAFQGNVNFFLLVSALYLRSNIHCITPEMSNSSVSG